MKRLKFMISLVMLLMAFSISSNSCSSTPDKTTEETSNNRWLEMLRLIPATDNTTMAAYVQDHAYLLEKKKQYPEVAEVMDIWSMMQNNRFWNLAHYDDNEWRQTMGFVRADVEIEVFAPRLIPLENYQALRGYFSRETIDTALKADPINDDLKLIAYHGLEFYSSGEDGMNLDKRSNRNPLGQGMRLAVVNDLVFATNFTGAMEEMIDNYQDNMESLADREAYQLLSTGIIKLDAFTAFFSTESQAQTRMKERYKDIIDDPGEGEGSRIRQTMAEQLQREVLLEPYQAYATGAGLDEKGYYMTIVLVYADEKMAKENVTLLEKQIRQSKTDADKPWTEFIESMEITYEGRLTMAKLYGHAASAWKGFDLTQMYEPLLMYKG